MTRGLSSVAGIQQLLQRRGNRQSMFHLFLVDKSCQVLQHMQADIIVLSTGAPPSPRLRNRLDLKYAIQFNIQFT